MHILFLQTKTAIVAFETTIVLSQFCKKIQENSPKTFNNTFFFQYGRKHKAFFSFVRLLSFFLIFLCDVKEVFLNSVKNDYLKAYFYFSFFIVFSTWNVLKGFAFVSYILEKICHKNSKGLFLFKKKMCLYVNNFHHKLSFHKKIIQNKKNPYLEKWLNYNKIWKEKRNLKHLHLGFSLGRRLYSGMNLH